MTLGDITDFSALGTQVICHIFSHTCEHQLRPRAMTTFTVWYWETSKQKIWGFCCRLWLGKFWQVFMLTNMAFHIQNLESSQGQEISMEKKTKDFLLFLSISKEGCSILNLGPHLKTKFLIQVVSQTHSHKKPRGKKKVMQTHTGSRRWPFHAFVLQSLLVAKSKAN